MKQHDSELGQSSFDLAVIFWTHTHTPD